MAPHPHGGGAIVVWVAASRGYEAAKAAERRASSSALATPSMSSSKRSAYVSSVTLAEAWPSIQLRTDFFDEGRRLDEVGDPAANRHICRGRIDYDAKRGSNPDSHHLDH